MLTLITRAESDSKRFARSLDSMGVKSMISPLITIEPVDIADIKDRCFQSVILTSKNAVQAAKFLNFEKSIPIYCVGDRTSSLAIASGFSNVYSAAGNSADLLNLFLEKSIPEPQNPPYRFRLLRGAQLAAANSDPASSDIYRPKHS